tara:strand:- start:13014 stop:13139 length:126 start_codon:yes stop_codon:yes gene_type:complete
MNEYIWFTIGGLITGIGLGIMIAMFLYRKGIVKRSRIFNIK